MSTNGVRGGPAPASAANVTDGVDFVHFVSAVSSSGGGGGVPASGSRKGPLAAVGSMAPPALTRSVSQGSAGLPYYRTYVAGMPLSRGVSGGALPARAGGGLLGGASGALVQGAGAAAARHREPLDWRSGLSIEERQSVRTKIRKAYSALCPDYETLLETCIAIEEELVHAGSPSRLDYLRAGFEFEGRVAIKRKQLARARASASPPTALGAGAAALDRSGAAASSAGAAASTAPPSANASAAAAGAGPAAGVAASEGGGGTVVSGDDNEDGDGGNGGRAKRTRV